MTVQTFDPNAASSCSTNTLGQMLDTQPATPTQSQPGAARIGFVSLGCPKNLVDSERILTKLRSDGYTMSHSPALYLIGPDGDWLRQFAYGTPASDILNNLRSRL